MAFMPIFEPRIAAARALPTREAFWRRSSRLPELNIGGNFYDLLGKDYLGAVNGDLVKEDGLLCAVRMDVEQA